MHRIRSVLKTDYEPLFSLVLETHLGFTNLPKNPERFKKFFQSAVEQNGLYLFVLEDIETKHLLGISGIYGATANCRYFKIEPIFLPPLFPEVPKRVDLLTRLEYEKGPSEICALFLSPEVRGKGLGKLLSLGRFLFIASHLEKFTENIFADMRGYLRADGSSPFWDGVGRHFYPVSFERLMQERDKNDEAALELIPKHPIYLDFLSQEAKDALGKTHIHTEPAIQMLLSQGFEKTNEFDLYDAGPRILAQTANVKSIKESRTLTLNAINEEPGSPALISNNTIPFHACLGTINPLLHSIDKKTAALLEVNLGDEIRYLL